MSKKIYKIPIIWQTIKTYEIEAENLQEAVKESLKEFFQEPCTDGDYLDDSFEVDSIIEENYPGEDYTINDAMQNL